MSLPDYIKISVAAVGGPDTPEGKEMLRLLTAPLEGELKTIEPVSATIRQSAELNDSILGDSLEDMFKQQFENKKE